MARKAGRRRKAEETAARAEATAEAARPVGREDQIIDATMNLIAERGWFNVALGDIAAASGLTLAQLYPVFSSKLAVLDAFERRVNEKTLEGGADVHDTVRDRLFDLIMRRLDALAPHKDALRALSRDLPRDPVAVLCTGPRFLNAMRWIAESAGMDTAGVGGLMRINGLAAVYLSTLRAWLRDDSPDNARTMAALDRALKRAELLMRSMPGMRRRPATDAA